MPIQSPITLVRGITSANRTDGGSIQSHGNRRVHDLIPSIRAWREAGESLRAIAKNLNAQGHTLRDGGPLWTATQVSRVLKQYC